MMTLMPVAAFAGTVGVAEAPEADMSYFVADGDDQTVTLKKAKEGLVFNAVLQDADEDATTGTIYVWAKDANGNITSALEAGWSLVPPIEQPRTINPFQILPKILLEDSYAGATFVLPNAQIGSIIGPHGSVITFIRSTSSAEITIEKVYERSSSRVITLRGSLQQVCIAMSLISKRLKQNFY